MQDALSAAMCAANETARGIEAEQGRVNRERKIASRRDFDAYWAVAHYGYPLIHRLRVRPREFYEGFANVLCAWAEHLVAVEQMGALGGLRESTLINDAGKNAIDLVEAAAAGRLLYVADRLEELTLDGLNETDFGHRVGCWLRHDLRALLTGGGAASLEPCNRPAETGVCFAPQVDDPLGLMEATVASAESKAKTPHPADLLFVPYASAPAPAECSGDQAKKLDGRHKGKLTTNQRMILVLDEKHVESMGWSVQQWADHLGVSKSTIHDTETWKRLHGSHVETKIRRKVDRHQRKKPVRPD